MGPINCAPNPVKSGNFGHRIHSDIHLQTVEIQMKWVIEAVSSGFSLFAYLILFYIPIIKMWNKLSHCPNLADRPNLTDFTL